jgi:hypothetical protein
MRSNILVLGWTMLAFLFGRLPRRTPADDVRPGNRYRRQLGSHLAATATVLDLRSDLVGIPHVQFSVTVDGSTTRLSEGNTRVLALQSFLDDYREPLGQEPQPDPNVTEHANVIRLLPKLSAA